MHGEVLFFALLPVMSISLAFGNPQALIATAICCGFNLIFIQVYAEDLAHHMTIFAEIVWTVIILLAGTTLGFIKDQIIKLRNAIAKIRTLSGLLPMCAGCKKIRNDAGYWAEVEEYISTRSEATFSHGLCPDCLEKHMPEYAEILAKREKNGQPAE